MAMPVNTKCQSSSAAVGGRYCTFAPPSLLQRQAVSCARLISYRLASQTKSHDTGLGGAALTRVPTAAAAAPATHHLRRASLIRRVDG